jgi:hypothetical protein
MLTGVCSGEATPAEGGVPLQQGEDWTLCDSPSRLGNKQRHVVGDFPTALSSTAQRLRRTARHAVLALEDPLLPLQKEKGNPAVLRVPPGHSSDQGLI